MEGVDDFEFNPLSTPFLDASPSNARARRGGHKTREFHLT